MPDTGNDSPPRDSTNFDTLLQIAAELWAADHSTEVERLQGMRANGQQIATTDRAGFLDAAERAWRRATGL